MLETVRTSLQGLGAFVAYFSVSLGLLIVFARIYVSITPYAEVKLIRDNNTAAALSFTGALAGFAIPLGSAVAHSVGLVDMLIWGIVAMVVQILTYYIVKLLFPKLPADIPHNHIPKGIVLGAISIIIGYLNAMCMSY
jgi:putative membrane protein